VQFLSHSVVDRIQEKAGWNIVLYQFSPTFAMQQKKAKNVIKKSIIMPLIKKQ